MRLQTSTLVALVFLVVGTSSIYSEKNCTQNNSGYEITYHSLHGGERRCCQRRICNKGTYGVPCEEGRPESTKCVDCDETIHYNPNKGHSDVQTHCMDKLLCHPQSGQIISDNGSTYENRKCKCDLENGYFTVSIDSFTFTPVCQRKECAAGTELYDDGTCQECPSYKFKAEEAYTRCKPLTDCKALGLSPMHVFNATHDEVCFNASAIGDPIVGPVEDHEGDSNKKFVIVGGVMAAFVCVVAVVIFVCWRHKKGSADSDSQGSAGERKTCLGDQSSVSDQEDNVENNKRIIKRDHDLKVDIPITYGEKVDLKGNHTPDSGIFTGYPPHLTPCFNGGLHHPPPYFITNLPSTGLQTDAEVFQGRPAESPSNDSDLHSSGVSSCPSKEEKLGEERHPHPSGGSIPPSGLTDAPPVIHIHHHYRQVGNRNQMVVKPTATAATDDLPPHRLPDNNTNNLNNCDYENDSYDENEDEDDGNYEDSEYDDQSDNSAAYHRSTTV